MNNKIKELAEEAGFNIDKYGLYWDQDANSDGVDLDTFAELIINEAAKWVNDNVGLMEEDDIQALRQHFGVDK